MIFKLFLTSFLYGAIVEARRKKVNKKGKVNLTDQMIKATCNVNRDELYWCNNQKISPRHHPEAK